MTERVHEKDAFEQFKENVKQALKSLDCWGSEDEIKLFTDILQIYRKESGLNPKMCANERPTRKVLCQLPKGHSGSHQAVVYWEVTRMSEEEKSFEQSLEENIYFTLRGCGEEGTIEIPKTLFNFIYTIAGTCTDDSETADYYNNPRAMFVALDLIYKVLGEIVGE